MRSRASVNGHPIHPALIPFPLAFLLGAFAFDALGTLLRRPSWWATGGHLAVAGIAMGLLAAVAGFVDYRATVPPRSSGKRRATRHALLNASALILFLIATLLRGSDGPATVSLVLEAVGAGMLGYGSWLGGTLVTRNQISVDHRYAGAGRWREQTLASSGGAVTVARRDELEVNQMKLVTIGDRRLVIGRTEDGYVAFDDRCTHRGGSLADGVMICGTVQCPWHGSQFDVRTGAVRAGPAKDPVACHPVEQVGDEIRVRVGTG